jgi:hypothetical protein
MKRRNLLLFIGILVAAVIWGAVYWFFVVPIIDPQ